MSREYRADHVGSFLRPPELLRAVGEHAAGAIGEEALRAAQDEAILRALELQCEVGVRIFSDGEYRRSWFAGAWAASVGGLVEAPPAPPAGAARSWRGPAAEAATQTLLEVLEGPSVVGEKIYAAKRMAGDECAFLAEHAPGPFKITFTSAAGQFNFWWREGITDEVYGSRQELLDDMVAILRDEVTNVVAEGASYVQLDSLGYVIQLADNENTRAFVEAGGDHDAALDQMIAADNAALAPAVEADDVVVGLHMCRGNNRSSWVSEGTYDPIAERAFAELNVDRFLLEYDTERAGGFEPLRFVPAPKIVVLGIVSSKEAELESQDTLLRRIEEASQYVPVERLALSPQCGFASTAKGNLLSWDDQRRKLELVVDTARKVWG